MAPKYTSRLATAHPLGKAAVLGMRRLGRSKLGQYLGTAWYRRRARLFAEDLMRLRGVTGVFITGSSLERVAPGYSDIDAMVFTELPTLADELRFRDELVPVVVRHNRPFELIRHLDYAEARDADVLQRFGNAYLLRQSTWELFAGRDPRNHKCAPTPRHRELAFAAASVQRWVGHGNPFVAPSSQADAFARARADRRRFQALLANSLELDRHLPLSTLLEAVRAHSSGEAMIRLARDPSAFERNPPSAIELMAASLEILDAHLGRVCKDFSHAWSAVVAGALEVAWDGARALIDAVNASPFDRLEVVARAPGRGQHVALLTTSPNASVLESVLAFERFCRNLDPLPEALFGRAELPVLLTPSMRSAAALIEPFPLAGLSLGAGAVLRCPANCAPPGAPNEVDVAILARMSLVELLLRTRGTMLRFRRQRAATLERTAREVVQLGPLLAALLDGRPIDLNAPPPETDQVTSAELVAGIRAALEDLRRRVPSAS